MPPRPPLRAAASAHHGPAPVDLRRVAPEALERARLWLARGPRWWWCPFRFRDAADDPDGDAARTVAIGERIQRLWPAQHSRSRDKRRRPPAAVYAPAWRPVAVAVQAAAWNWLPVVGVRPLLALYAPHAGARERLAEMFEPAWEVRAFATRATLLAALMAQDPSFSASLVVYVPDGTEFAPSVVEELPDGVFYSVAPVAELARVRFTDLLRGWTAVVYCPTPEAQRGVPLDVAGLPVRPIYDARDVVPGVTASSDVALPAWHVEALCALAVRSRADRVADRAWQDVIRWVDAGRTGVGLAGVGAVGGWGGESRAAADALRRLFLRPERYPDEETLAHAVGLSVRALTQAVARFGLAPVWTLRQVMLAFHATWALWAAQASPGTTAEALGIPLRRLNLAVRACTGMTPEHVRRWGVVVSPEALFDALLVERPSAAMLGRKVVGAGVPVYLAPDPGRLPGEYASLPRFTADVLPALPGGHPYAYAHPASPYHTRRRPPAAAAPPARGRV